MMQKTNLWRDWNFGSALKDAYTAIYSALRPRRPIRAVTQEDILNVDSPLSVWETSQEISIRVSGLDGGLLVDEMMGLIQYISSLPDFSGTDIMDQLRQRVVRLGHHLQTMLLQEARANQRELSPTLNDEEADIQLLRSWGQQIQNYLLDDGSRSIILICDHIPRVFDYLQAFKDLKLSTLVKAEFPLVLREILDAPCIPNLSGVTPFRTQAAVLLTRWAQLPEAQMLTSEGRAIHGLSIAGIESHLLPSTSSSGTPDVVSRLGEISETLEKFERAAAEADVEEMDRLVTKMEKWGPIEDSSLVINLDIRIRRVSGKVRRTAESNKPFTAAITSRIENLLDSHKPAGRRRLTGLSYCERPLDSVISIRFRNTSKALNSQPPLWEDLQVECSLSDPLQRLLERFTAEVNRLNRHPFFPVTMFDISSDKNFHKHTASIDEGKPEIHPITHLQTHHAKFTQGRVSSVHFSPASSENVLYYYRGTGQIMDESPELRKLPSFRILPPSCVPPPKHWYTPSPPRGHSADWDIVNSLAFTDDGDEIWPYATYPPVIASHIYFPKAIETLRGSTLGFRNRGAVGRDFTPFKLYPPLTMDQAKGLVGYTIQYEEELDPFASVKEPAMKKRKLGTSVPAHSLSGDVFFAFVWGFDPEGMELKAFESFEGRDVSRTILVGPRKTDFPVPVPQTAQHSDNFHAIALHHPFMPRWLGSVSLSDEAIANPSGPPAREPVHATDAIGTQEMSDDRLSIILRKAPREFEVGIGGDFGLLVGELGIHAPGSFMIETIENCKGGVWESGCTPPDFEDSGFSIWVQWIREGSIDLGQPVDAFGNNADDARPLPTELVWTRATDVGVDGGTVSILARGITAQDSITALTARHSVTDTYSVIQYMVTTGHEEEKFYIPGGVSSGTGGDGSFSVDVARDVEGKIIAVKISDSDSFLDEEQEQ